MMLCRDPGCELLQLAPPIESCIQLCMLLHLRSASATQVLMQLPL
jgi:hypothetical protein